MRIDKLQASRFEQKYLINEETALRLREFVRSYLDLDENGVGRPDYSYPVHSLYLDSPASTMYWQTINGTKTVNLPAATVWCVYVRNLSNVGNITVNFTPTAGVSESLVLVAGATAGNGGVFIYHQPAETAGGITALSITAAAILPACVLAAS